LQSTFAVVAPVLLVAHRPWMVITGAFGDTVEVSGLGAAISSSPAPPACCAGTPAFCGEGVDAEGDCVCAEARVTPVLNTIRTINNTGYIRKRLHEAGRGK
jgi:hypothetical protein